MAANATGAAKPVFRDLHQCSLAAPDGMPTAALADSFVAVPLASQPQRDGLSWRGDAEPQHCRAVSHIFRHTDVPYRTLLRLCPVPHLSGNFC